MINLDKKHIFNMKNLRLKNRFNFKELKLSMVPNINIKIILVLKATKNEPFSILKTCKNVIWMR